MRGGRATSITKPRFGAPSCGGGYSEAIREGDPFDSLGFASCILGLGTLGYPRLGCRAPLQGAMSARGDRSIRWAWPPAPSPNSQLPTPNFLPPLASGASLLLETDIGYRGDSWRKRQT